MDDDVPEFIYPMPNDKSGHIGNIVTDSEGNAEFKMRILEVGRHTIYAKGEDSKIEASATVVVLPNCSTKSEIKDGNRILRAAILASTNLEEISKHMKESKLMCDVAPEKLKGDAIKEFERTAAVANNRLEQLRLTERKRGFALKAGNDQASIEGSFTDEFKKSKS